MNTEKTRESSSAVMAVLSVEAKETMSGCYHILSADRTRSLCGNVNNESPFAADVRRIIPRRRAESRGFEVCGLCGSFTDS